MPRHYDTADGLCHEPDAETDHYKLNHTMVRIKDPVRSLDFYTRALGMRLVRRLDFEDMQFTLYFLGYLDEREIADMPREDAKRSTFAFGREGLVELTHNWGDEDTPEVQFHSGNEDPKGYGHIGITVPDVNAAAERLDNLGIEFIKRPEDGKMNGLAFVKDPDGYWIEILQADMLE
ncbi:MAG: lactoylglutathione lyase [Halofilum sp. (in: g-proteobacteria)]